jgi:hypothetical protein
VPANFDQVDSFGWLITTALAMVVVVGLLSGRAKINHARKESYVRIA